jgi:hypothetical protein
VQGTGRHRLTNARLLFGLAATTLVVSGFGLIADPQARLTSLLVFLPAFVAGQGTVRQTVFAGAWSTAAVITSVVHHPEPRTADNVVVLSGAVLFAAFAAIACRRRIAGEDQIDRLRSTATALQRQILRPLPQRDELVRVDGVYEPVQEDRLVGGDIYDVAATAYGTRVLIGDVQGKGVPALGAGIAVIGAFREAAHREATLPGLVEAMEAATVRHNADAAHEGEPERFVTALVLCFGTEAEVRAVDCGHLPAYLLGPGGPSRVRLAESGVPLGLADLVDAPRVLLRLPAGRDARALHRRPVRGAQRRRRLLPAGTAARPVRRPHPRRPGQGAEPGRARVRAQQAGRPGHPRGAPAPAGRLRAAPAARRAARRAVSRPSRPAARCAVTRVRRTRSACGTRCTPGRRWSA